MKPHFSFVLGWASIVPSERAKAKTGRAFRERQLVILRIPRQTRAARMLFSTARRSILPRLLARDESQPDSFFRQPLIAKGKLRIFEQSRRIGAGAREVSQKRSFSPEPRRAAKSLEREVLSSRMHSLQDDSSVIVDERTAGSDRLGFVEASREGESASLAANDEQLRAYSHRRRMIAPSLRSGCDQFIAAEAKRGTMMRRRREEAR
jgi:hypothetical protein